MSVRGKIWSRTRSSRRSKSTDLSPKLNTSGAGGEVAVFIDPELPFSRPLQKGSQSRGLFAFMFVIAIASSFLQIFSAWLYASATWTLAAFVALWLVSAAVDRLTRVRVEHQTASLEFAG